MKQPKFTAKELDNAIEVLPDNMGIAVVENEANQDHINSVYWHLKSEGIVYTQESEETGVICAGLTSKGLLLRNKGGFTALDKKEQKKNRTEELELEALEYQRKIRKQNDLIRIWQLITIGGIIVGFILGHFFGIKL